MGTASSENADATATSATALFSRAATIATATKLAGSNGSVSDRRVSGDSDQKPRNPAPATIAPVIASHAAARRRSSRFARAPRLPSKTNNGSCARNAATAATAISKEAEVTPATANDVTSGKAS
jgi:hypothetical protein